MTETRPPAVAGTGLFHIYRERGIETVALRGADLTVEAGGWTSIVGPSGSGKSTLVHILAGLLEPSAGSVLIEGEDLTRLPLPERARRRRQRIGVVLQRDNLHPLLGVGGNVALPLRLDGMSGSKVKTRVAELLESVGMAGRERQPVGQLSGGEVQRVAVAAAVAARPVVLLADELTGELDDANTVAVLDQLAKLRQSEAMAVLTVTHNPVVAARADQRLELREGLLVPEAA